MRFENNFIPIVNAADHPKTVFWIGDNNPSDLITHATNEYMLIASSNMKTKHAVKKKWIKMDVKIQTSSLFPWNDGNKKKWAKSNAISIFMWMTRDESNILATAKITRVATRNMIKIVDAPRVKITTAVFCPGDNEGWGLAIDINNSNFMLNQKLIIKYDYDQCNILKFI